MTLFALPGSRMGPRDGYAPEFLAEDLASRTRLFAWELVRHSVREAVLFDPEDSSPDGRSV